VVLGPERSALVDYASVFQAIALHVGNCGGNQNGDWLVKTVLITAILGVWR